MEVYVRKFLKVEFCANDLTDFFESQYFRDLGSTF